MFGSKELNAGVTFDFAVAVATFDAVQSWIGIVIQVIYPFTLPQVAEREIRRQPFIDWLFRTEVYKPCR